MAGIVPIVQNLDDLAEAIKDPPPDRPFAEAIGRQGRFLCDSFANAPAWAKGLAGQVGGPFTLGALRTVCKPYWDSQGVDEPVITDTPKPGQCDADYLATGIVNGNDQAIGGLTPRTVRGPLTGLTVTDTLLGTPFPDSTRRLWEWDDNSRDNFVGVIYRAGQNPSLSFRLERLDSEPDDCGEPEYDVEPGDNPPPDPGPVPPDQEPFNDPRRGPVFRMPDLPTLPNLPGLPIPTRPFGDGGGGADPADQGEPGDEVEADGIDDAEGEAEPGQELVGLKLRLTTIPPKAKEWEPGIYRGVCYAYMGGDNGLDQDFAGRSVRDGQFIFAETPGLTKWAVSAINGFKVGVTPYYREVS